MPARVLMQDFTGVPAIVDLAAMRDAMADLGGDPRLIEPGIPVDLVIDHSIVADVAGVADAFVRNAELEFARNRERYTFLRWAQSAFQTLRVFPPNRGICHQVNLEYLAQVVFRGDGWPRVPRHARRHRLAHADGQRPRRARLGRRRDRGRSRDARPAALDAVAARRRHRARRRAARRLDRDRPRAHGRGAAARARRGRQVRRVLRRRASGACRSRTGRRSATCRPSTDRRARSSPSTTRRCATCAPPAVPTSRSRWSRPTPRNKASGTTPSVRPVYDETISFDLSTVEPSLAGPSRPQDRVSLAGARSSFEHALLAFRREETAAAATPPIGTKRPAADEAVLESFPASDPPARAERRHRREDRPSGDEAAVAARSQALPGDAGRRPQFELADGHVVIAAITSCTNTSNPSVMIAAGLLARNAVARADRAAVGEDVAGARLVGRHRLLRTRAADGAVASTRLRRRRLRMHHVHRQLRTARARDLRGDRPRRPLGRVRAVGEPQLRGPYLSRLSDELPRVAAARRRVRARGDDGRRPGRRSARPRPNGSPVYLRELWPSEAEVAEVVGSVLDRAMFVESYATILDGDENWRALPAPTGDRYEWDPDSTYIRRPTFLEGITATAPAVHDIDGARVLALLGDSVTTDHISPAGAIRRDGPAGKWLLEHGVAYADFNSYGSRRGNHEVMVRGTFANIRLRNRLAPGTEGGVTVHLPESTPMTIYDAAMHVRDRRRAARRARGQGVRLGLVARLGGEGFAAARDPRRARRELRAHPPFEPGRDGPAAARVRRRRDRRVARPHRARDLPRRRPGGARRSPARCRAGHGDADDKEFAMRARIDTPFELEVFLAGGILPYTLRRLARLTRTTDFAVAIVRSGLARHFRAGNGCWTTRSGSTS